ncbi:MAG: thioesterase family protein [Tumebacillaceae bacterium]
MKAGMKIGDIAEASVVVTPEMRPQFDGHIVHDVYSTAAMVHLMEHAARKILLPYLEEHEEGMGVSVSVTHLAPTPVGLTVRAQATVTELTARKIVTAVEVWNNRVQIGEGVVVQAVLPKAQIHARIREMAETADK